MRFTVHYIPLDKIKAGVPFTMTERLRKLRRLALDCMHILIVRKSRKNGGYILLRGNQHYEFLRKHTKKSHAPCIVEEGKALSRVPGWLSGWLKPRLPYSLPRWKLEQVSVSAWSIMRAYMKEEPRYRELSKKQQLKVLLLAIRYQRTTVNAMKAKTIEELHSRKS